MVHKLSDINDYFECKYIDILRSSANIIIISLFLFSIVLDVRQLGKKYQIGKKKVKTVFTCRHLYLLDLIN